MINPRQCKFYAQGYCCHRVRCGEGRDNCRKIAFCGYGRLRCCVKIGSDTKCIMFKEKFQKIHKQADYTPDEVRNAYAMAECGRCIRIFIWNFKLKKYVRTNTCRLTWKGVNCKDCLRSRK
jgi:hypothetical protein